MDSLGNYRSIDVEGSTTKLTELRQKKDDIDNLIKNLENNFLDEFQGNYNSTRSLELKNEIDGMKAALEVINAEIGNLERIEREYVESTETVDEGR
jgi:prefoldin subunit 5